MNGRVNHERRKMTVEQDHTRKAVPVTWDLDVVKGDTADIRCVNPENEDVSTQDDVKNDGLSVVTFPINYAGECNVTVTGSDDGEDTGTITVK
jgi:hypothetical protein